MQKKLKMYQRKWRALAAVDRQLREVGMGSTVIHGSMTRHPYTETSYTVSGIDHERIERLIAKREKLREECKAIRAYVDAIEDEYIQTLVEQFYIEGLTWVQIALRQGGGVTADGARMVVNRFFEEK